MGTMRISGNGSDVIGYLKGQHAQIKGLFGEVLGSTGQARASKFYELRRLMAVHETAEESIVHPAARKALMSIGESIVAARLKEEHAAKIALGELEKLGVDSPEFEAKFRALEAAVLAHAEKEETEEFSKLGEAIDTTHLVRMKRAAEIMEAVAPTRPHPGVESAAANLFLAPFASMMDRARDLITGHS